MFQLLTSLQCRFMPKMAELLFVLPFYNFLKALVSPSKIVELLFLALFFISAIYGNLPNARAVSKSNKCRLYELPLIAFVVFNAFYIVNTSSSLEGLAKHGFWLLFAVYLYHYFANTKRLNESKHVLVLLYFASLVIAFCLVIDNFNKLILRIPALFDAITYAHKWKQDASLDPHHLSYRATGLLGSRALTTGFVGLGGLAGLALYWRSRVGGFVLSVHSVLLCFCFGLTAFIGFQLAVLSLLILAWSRDRFLGHWGYLKLIALITFAVIFYDLLAHPWIASRSYVTDFDAMPRSVGATLIVMIDQWRIAIMRPHEMGIIGLYFEQLRAFVNSTGLFQLLIGIAASGDRSGLLLGWEWGWLDWFGRIGILGAGTIIFMLFRSIISSGKLLRAGESSLPIDVVDGVILIRFVFLASVFLLITSFHYEILLTREMLPFFFYLLALSRILSKSLVIGTPRF